MRRLSMRGLRARAGEERGAVGVMVALMLVPLLGFASADAAADATARTYADLTGSGADLRTLGPTPGSTLTTPATNHPLTDPVASALAFYLFAAHLALHRDLDPDAPPLRSKVTLTR